MRIILFLFLSQLFFYSTYAQSTRSLRLNIGLSPGQNEAVNAELAPPAAAFQIQTTPHWRHGFELTRLELRERQAIDSLNNVFRMGLLTRDFHFAIRYQLDYLLGQETSKWRAYIGTSAQLGIEHLINRPFVSNFFNTESTELYLDISVIPGLQRSLTEKLTLYVALPIRLTRTSLQLENTDNPSIPINEQQTGILTLDVLPRPLGSLRLGLSYVI